MVRVAVSDVWFVQKPDGPMPPSVDCSRQTGTCGSSVEPCPLEGLHPVAMPESEVEPQKEQGATQFQNSSHSQLCPRPLPRDRVRQQLFTATDNTAWASSAASGNVCALYQLTQCFVLSVAVAPDDVATDHRVLLLV